MALWCLWPLEHQASSCCASSSTKKLDPPNTIDASCADGSFQACGVRNRNHSGTLQVTRFIQSYHFIAFSENLSPPWNRFSNIDFPYPGIISAITDPHPEIISAGVLGPENHFLEMTLYVTNYSPKGWDPGIISCFSWNDFRGAGTPKLLLVMTPQNHFTQLAEMILGRRSVYWNYDVVKLSAPPPGDSWVKHLTCWENNAVKWF